MILKRLNRTAVAFGIDLRVCIHQMMGIPAYFVDALRYIRRLGTAERFALRLSHLQPILTDRKAKAGHAAGHYFHQDLWAAREIYRKNPQRHVDIGSRIDGFVAHLLVFRSVEVVDVRQLESADPNLQFQCTDATYLSAFPDNSIESLSSLHAAEHFGLGRYGDEIDPFGYLKLIKSLVRVLKPDGDLYFAVPCGVERLEFNAHRIFDPTHIIDSFRPLRLISLHGVLDDGSLYENVELEILSNQQYGCGLFHFKK